MVDAKRQRNQQVLLESGLLSLAATVRASARPVPTRTHTGLTARKRNATHDGKFESARLQRKSNRIAGIASDGLYVQEERAGRFTLAGTHDTNNPSRIDSMDTANTTNHNNNHNQNDVKEHYRGRVNDGADLSLAQVVALTGPKWTDDDSLSHAQALFRRLQSADFAPPDDCALPDTPHAAHKEMDNTTTAIPCKVVTPGSTPTNTLHNTTDTTIPSHDQFVRQVQHMSVDSDHQVAKVVPDRIYGIAAHPSPHQLIVCAGDKSGYVGIWNVDAYHPEKDTDKAVHVFKYHSGAAACLQWNSNGTSLLSASYDGTVRVLDVATASAQQVFATFDDDPVHAHRPGANTDTGYRFWTQYACWDASEQGLFVATSIGTALHVDLRTAPASKVTFHEQLAEKKINTLSLHRNGHTLLSAGLDCQLQTWDWRKLGDNRTSRHSKAPSPVASYHCGKSVNSAFFSPTGTYAVATTMAHKLDIFTNLERASGSNSKPTKSLRHDNLTGRWLTTFMAVWHPTLDVFGVGSMQKPRAVEIFDPSRNVPLVRAIQGDALTAVASRCAFHASTDRPVLVGGNSSGRVTIVR